MLHGSETWPVRKENEVALQRAEMGMVKWMCGVKLQDRVPSKELRGRLGLDDIISVLQRNRLRWYGHVLRKEDNDWVKKCMEYEVEGSSSSSSSSGKTSRLSWHLPKLLGHGTTVKLKTVKLVTSATVGLLEEM